MYICIVSQKYIGNIFLVVSVALIAFLVTNCSRFNTIWRIYCKRIL